MAKYFIIAGEASGDLHASNLILALQKQDTNAMFIGMGGDKMQAAGCTLVQHYREMAFMGFVAVLKNLGKVRRNFHIAHEALLHEKPDVLILIDYPSFNLKIAEWCKKHLPETKIYYYIPPKVWAWKRWRVHKIAQLSDKILCIFPFEPAFYAKYGYKAEYVGNPTVDSIRDWTKNDARRDECIASSPSPLIAILPGSRKHEIEKCLPKMLEAARKVVSSERRMANGEWQIVVTGAPGIEPAFYDQFLTNEKIVFNETYELVSRAAVAIVNSGTATLETALLNCPQVAVYHIACGRLVGLIRPFVFQIPHFTLVNLIPNKEVIKEKIAYLFTVDEVADEVQRILKDDTYRQTMLNNYAEIRKILGDNPAAETAAKAIVGK